MFEFAGRFSPHILPKRDPCGENNYEFKQKGPVQDKAPDPPIISGRNLDQIHLEVREWLQPADFRSNAVQDHMQKQASQSNANEGFQLAPVHESRHEPCPCSTGDPEKGPVKDVSVVDRLPLIDKVEPEQIGIGQDRRHEAGRNQGLAMALIPAQPSGKKITGGKMGDEHQTSELTTGTLQGQTGGLSFAAQEPGQVGKRVFAELARGCGGSADCKRTDAGPREA